MSLVNCGYCLRLQFLHAFLLRWWLLERQIDLLNTTHWSSKVELSLNILAFFQLILKLFQTLLDRIDRLLDLLINFLVSR